MLPSSGEIYLHNIYLSAVNCNEEHVKTEAVLQTPSAAQHQCSGCTACIRALAATHWVSERILKR